jgi:basic membrane protein A and related proteins
VIVARWCHVSVTLSFVLALSGCVPRSSAAPTPVDADPFTVAMVLPGPINDRSWNQSGYEGLQQIERELGAQIVYRAEVPEGEFAAAFRRFAAEGSDLVIGHGNQFAAEYPGTKFAIMGSSPGNNINFGAIDLRHDETGYLIGVVAALKTTTNKVAYIGGQENESQRIAIAGLLRGARATNPAVELDVRWIDSWSDAERGRALAREAVQSGADVLIQNADSAGLAVLEEARALNVLAIGWAQDQHAVAPGTVVTSALQRTPTALLYVASLVRRGRWEGKQYRLGISEGALDLAPFRGALSAEQEQLVQQTRDAIVTGKIQTYSDS